METPSHLEDHPDGDHPAMGPEARPSSASSASSRVGPVGINASAARVDLYPLGPVVPGRPGVQGVGKKRPIAAVTRWLPKRNSLRRRLLTW
jgi:hypothetical protein